MRNSLEFDQCDKTLITEDYCHRPNTLRYHFRWYNISVNTIVKWFESNRLCFCSFRRMNTHSNKLKNDDKKFSWWNRHRNRNTISIVLWKYLGLSANGYTNHFETKISKYQRGYLNHFIFIELYLRFCVQCLTSVCVIESEQQIQSS